VTCGVNSAGDVEKAGGAVVGLGVGVEALKRQAREASKRIQSRERVFLIV